MHQPGRPLKYRHFIAILEPHTLYTPASIATLGGVHGFFRGTDPAQFALERRRVRITMARFGSNHQFPKEGDGHIKLKGQAFTPAWFGWRWQAAAGFKPDELNPKDEVSKPV